MEHSEGFGVIISGDKKDDQIIDQIMHLKAQNVADIAVYDRQSFLRTVARYRKLEAER